MNLPKRHLIVLSVTATFLAANVWATNPLIMDQFTADPTARVFWDRIYVYPSHDIPPIPGKTRPDWFCMEDYHVFSSANLTDWQDHGVIVRQTEVEWADPNAYSMWAPDCVFKSGKYYFFFPAIPKEGKGFRIGVAIADKPEGPFKPQPKPIEDVQGIDPCVFIDRDGSAYLFYSRGKIKVAKLKNDMTELDGQPQVVDNLPAQGLLEGPFVFERKGVYYLTYPHVEKKTERLEYATAAHPLGPYTPAGVILDESPSGCWTVHQSIVEYQGQWYLFYHDKDLSPAFDKNRSIRADRLSFNDDGTIKKVIPTLRGVGTVAASSEIQIDRYSAISPEGAVVSFLNPADVHAGWKIELTGNAAWVRFNDVDFGKGSQPSVEVRASSIAGGVIEIRLDRADGPVLGRVAIAGGSEWKTIPTAIKGVPPGMHDLFVSPVGSSAVELDWLRFQ